MTERGNERTLASFSLSSAADAAAAVNLAFFSCFDSGRYLFNSLNNCVAVFLSRVCENWAMAGGTLRRWCRITFFLWRRTYSGHLTKRVRSVWGRMSWPGPKLSFRATRETTTRQRTDTKVLGIGLEQKVLLRLGGLACTKGGRGGFLACSGFGFGLVIETK